MVFLRLVLCLAVVCTLVACGEAGKQGVATEAPNPVAESDFVKTESGLQYYDFKVGKGASPSKGKKVTVHYSGWLTDGKLFVRC